jgi:putative endonuclease
MPVAVVTTFGGRDNIAGRGVASLVGVVCMRARTYYVYLLTNWDNTVMYVGMTNDLERRMHEHKEKTVKGFTEKYNVTKLVYFEQGSEVNVVIAREKEIKKWRREKKNALVERANPDWRDLSDDSF